jgi:3-oxoacyl-[acyl-carrier protein] reductase
MRSAGGEAMMVVGDLKEEVTAGTIVAATVAEFRRIDILVNSAGDTKRVAFVDSDDADWLNGFALKFFAAVRLIRGCWPYLKLTQGAVLNLAGVAGRTPGSQFSIGGSVNAALLSLTKALAETGIADQVQVNAINPGPVKTERLAAQLRAIGTDLRIAPEEAERHLLGSQTITRLGTPSDVAALAEFILSPAGRWIHGSLIDLDGGLTKTM